MRNVDVQGEMTYMHDTAQALSVNKRGKKLSSIKPAKPIQESVKNIRPNKKMFKSFYKNTVGPIVLRKIN